MPARLFALIIGIDSYKSGSIWNLETCVQDAKHIQRWLLHDLCVPKDQICTLLDQKATKAGIEENIMSHLVHNPAIDRGDAILIYFAGHGSNIPSPQNWFEADPRACDSAPVEVICPHDHHAKTPTGRVAGISDRSLQALLAELCKAKGDNITLILDCCFSPRQTKEMIRDRRHIRWTPTPKVDPGDLINGLWAGARDQKHSRTNGFYQTSTSTHILIAACRPGEGATEGKEGGRLTAALIEASSTLPLHRLTYVQLVSHLSSMMSTSQVPLCAGRNRDRPLFNGVPFVTDARYVPVGLDEDKKLRIEVGSIHGIVLGSEFTLHLHNIRGSLNTALANLKVSEVHPTWSLCHPITPGTRVPRRAWAKVLRWNNRPPFRVHLKKTVSSFLRWWKLCRNIPSKSDEKASGNTTMNLLRVRASQAHLSLDLSGRAATIVHHDDFLDHSKRAVKIDDTMSALSLLDKAARFHLHLCRRNPDHPLRNLVTMELFKLDPISWRRTGANLLVGDQANIDYEQNTLYSVVMHNKSEVDLWPSLAYMDPNCYGITMLYYPDPQATVPLPKSSQLEIGTGRPGSEALSFTLEQGKKVDSGFLKLFVTSSPVPMGIIEQGPSLSLLGSPIADVDIAVWKPNTPADVWDTVHASVSIRRMA